MSLGRLQRIVAALVWGGLLALGSTAEADLLGVASSEGYRLSAKVYRQGAALRIDGTDGAVSKEVDEEWDVQVSPRGALIGLLRESRTGTQLRLLDAAGNPVSERFFPLEEKATVTDRGIVTLPHSGDQMLTRHHLRFYATSGEQVGEADEPELAIFTARHLPGGGILTENGFPGAGETTLVVYDHTGHPLFWQVVPVTDMQRVTNSTVSPDGGRLIYVTSASGPQHGAMLNIVNRAGQVVAQHALSDVNELRVSPDSTRIAALGTSNLALLDANQGELIWNAKARFDAPALNGLRFSDDGDELFILSSRLGVQRATAGAYFYRVGLADGVLDTYFLGEHPTHDGLTLLGVAQEEAGRLRLILPRREILIEGIESAGVIQ
jgi:hypothetical protein